MAGVTRHIAGRLNSRKAFEKEAELRQDDDQIEQLKSSACAKIKHAFRVIKRQFGHNKVRSRGLAKKTAQLCGPSLPMMDFASRTEPVMPATAAPDPNLGPDPALAWMAQWPLRSFEFMLQSLQMQLEAWRCWQGSMQTMQGDFWDWWTSHWAGGAPLDG